MRTMLLVTTLLAVMGCGDKAPEPSTTSESTEKAVEGVYECPMHCKLEGHDEPYTQEEPGKCPVCGMELTPQKKP